MGSNKIKRIRLLIAWTLCAACALCGAALAVLLWWMLPASVALRQPDGALRWVMAVMLGVGFLVFSGTGIVVGVGLSRRMLTSEEFSALTRVQRAED
jgi:hypothetical protein